MTASEARKQLDTEELTIKAMDSSTANRLETAKFMLNQAFLDGVSFGLKLAEKQIDQ
jgi:hypothetical protein